LLGSLPNDHQRQAADLVTSSDDLIGSVAMTIFSSWGRAAIFTDWIG
jgi:hypothetical protein